MMRFCSGLLALSPVLAAAADSLDAPLSQASPAPAPAETASRVSPAAALDHPLPNWVFLAAALLGLFVAEWLLAQAARRLRAAVAVRAAEGRLPALRIQRAELIPAARTGRILVLCITLVAWALHFAVLYGGLMIAFSLSPLTRAWGGRLQAWVMSPLRSAVEGMLDFLPNLVHIAVVLLLAHLFLRALRKVAREIEAGNLRFPGFYADWARPTLNIASFITYAFVLVVIFPYLPGSDSPVFKGVSVFLGLLFSLGSSSALANVIAGLVITYMRAFKVGDRVRFGDVTGDVVEKTLLVTRLRTVYHETITLPNSALLQGNTVNYSEAASSGAGLLLSTTVSVGYGTPWRKVHELLLEAAKRTAGVLSDPAPFVLQSGFDDFYVRYELNVATRESHRMRFLHSELRQHIQDVFFEAGVELLSPHHRAVHYPERVERAGERSRAREDAA